MSGIVYFIVALLIFGLIIFVHELGHYLVARLCGITVLEFAMGFGPKLLGWKRKGIDYSVRMLPMGGYCKFAGEDESSDDPHAFTNARVWQRFLTILAGPVMNFVLAYAAVVVFVLLVGTLFYAPVVGAVTPGTPAEAAGMMAGDVITAVDGQAIENTSQGAQQMVDLIGRGSAEAPVELAVERQGQPMLFSVAPQKDTDGQYRIGIELGFGVQRHSLGGAMSLGVTQTYAITREMLSSFKGLLMRGEGLEDTMGPVGIISFMTQEISRNFDTVINLIVVISLNVGILNLLPLPALDGGRLVFLIIEGVRKKPVKPEYEGWVHAAGFVLLLGLIAVFTYRDIVRLFTGGWS
jgi:regulator of sigma E protease